MVRAIFHVDQNIFSFDSFIYFRAIFHVSVDDSWFILYYPVFSFLFLVNLLSTYNFI